VIEPLQPGIQKVVEAASRKGAALDIRFVPATAHTAETIAAAVDTDPGSVVQAVVYVVPRPEGRLVPIVCLISGRNQIDPALLAAVTGEFSIREATAREARELTSYEAGEIPPIGHGRDVRILMDQDLCQYQWIWASAGSASAVFRVAPRTLRMLSNAVVAPLAAASWMTAPSGAMDPRQLVRFAS
jgi:prolyl-tRNA editing enzyme YbaK/EbsC (Cys-tRNA(Pro) deacylase)